jgi:hypothetical protein
MRLVLTRASELPGAPGIGLSVDELTPHPLDAAAFRKARLQAISPKIAVLSEQPLRSDDGWPVHVVGAEIVDGARRELRLHAFYSLFDRLGHATAWAVDERLFATHARALTAILLSGRPDFRGGPIVALAEL